MIISYMLYVLGGLSIFLYGLNSLKKFFSNTNSTYAYKLIANLTKNDLRAFLVGIFVTLLVQSSSCITAIVLTFLSCNLLTKKTTMIIIIGSNIGTCFTSFLFAISMDYYCFIILFIGLFLSFFKNKKINNISVFFYCIGFIFCGLFLLESGLNYISQFPIFKQVLLTLSSSILTGIVSSSIITAIVQSSTLIIALTQNLYSLNLINIEQSFIIILGANIGTCITGIISTLNGSIESKEIAKANVIFNILGSFLFILLSPFLIRFFKYLEDCLFNNNAKISISFIHSFFNISTGILGFIFVDYLISISSINFFKRKVNLIDN